MEKLKNHEHIIWFYSENYIQIIGYKRDKKLIIHRKMKYEKKHVIEGMLCSIQEAVILYVGSTWNLIHSESAKEHISQVQSPFHSGYFIGTPAPLFHLFSLLPVRDIASRFG